MSESATGTEFPLVSSDFSVQNSGEHSAEKLWNTYFGRLRRFAANQMKGMPKIASDEEDITLSVLKSVCLSLRDGRIGKIDDDQGLWHLLVVICKRKIANQYAYQRRAKRDVSRAQPFDGEADSLRKLECQEFRPEMLLEFKERFEDLLARLEKDTLKTIALAKLQNYTNFCGILIMKKVKLSQKSKQLLRKLAQIKEIAHYALGNSDEWEAMRADFNEIERFITETSKEKKVQDADLARKIINKEVGIWSDNDSD